VDQPAEDATSGEPPEGATAGDAAASATGQPWDTVRRVREPVAWTLLVLTAIFLLTSVWELFALPGGPVIAAPVAASGPVPASVTGTAPGPGLVVLTNFGIRASALAPQFVAGGMILLPVLAVGLVAFAGGLTDRARQVVQAAILIQAVTLGFSVVSWLGALGSHTRAGIWFIVVAAQIALLAAALVFTAAVRRSKALHSLAPQFQDYPEEDDDFGEEYEESGDEDWAH
jgi:hypothetical protein